MTQTKTAFSPTAFVFAAMLSFVAWNSTLAMPHASAAASAVPEQTTPAFI